MPLTIKPTHKVITDYYATIEEARNAGQQNEGTVAPYFAQLLRHALGQFPHLTLMEQYTIKRDGRKPLRADGAIVDKQTGVLLYGVWEAKDSKDRLEREVQNKFKDGYPDDNILFQSPDQLILYQDGIHQFTATIKDNPQRLIEIIDAFLSYKPPVYARWQEAIEAFKDKVSELGQALVQIILTELKVSKVFKVAFEHFTALCHTTLNPNLSQAAVIEMLVQHLLTERLFRTIFNNPEFINNNVIAFEIDKVIRALTVRSFNRHEFLHSLDRFYVAIEETSSTIHAYSRKQEFLNVVYENFFQGFAIKMADTHGIVYTPQPIVDFMVQSVQEILKREFNQDLANAGVEVLDPFVGTGNFILRIMQEIAANKHDLAIKDKFKHKYAHELFCNEVMLLPYYIACMNIEHAYYAYMGEYTPFTGICLVDTFDLGKPEQPDLDLIPENTLRINKQKAASIFVIIGNPPYNMGQKNENDGNRNRKYPHIDGIVADTYVKQSKATNKNSLSDVYIKAFAWATERLKNQDRGIIAFVSNNSFLDGIAADGMRKVLGKDFNKIYIFNLGGNSRKSDDDLGNVFGIRVGVAITILVKNGTNSSQIYYARIGRDLKKSAKLEFLTTAQHMLNLNLQPIIPDAKYNWLAEGLDTDFVTFSPIGSKEGKTSKTQLQNLIFKVYGRGITTSGDTYIYNHNNEALITIAQGMVESFNAEKDRWKRSGRTNDMPSLEAFLKIDEKVLKWIRHTKRCLLRGSEAAFDVNKIRLSLYRPYCTEYCYFDRTFSEDFYRFPKIFPTPETEQENLVICLSGIGSGKPFHSLMVQVIPCLDMLEKTQCFPFYTYNKDGTNRQENLTDWALQAYQTHYHDQSIDKWAIFYYIYGLLHHHGYRDKYAANLKRELPRIPYAPDFWGISRAGAQLANLHLNYETQPEYPLKPTVTDTLDWRVEKMRLNKDKTAIIYNLTLTLNGIPASVFDYRLGNRSALEWVIDQYQVTTDKRSGIVNDPNRPDDERYIVRLVQQIITVSLETVRLVKEISRNDGILPAV